MIKKVIGNKKGFTLVEIIVVLVILAILAAFLVPTLTGYIDKANQRVAVAEARSFLMAAQSLTSEEYGIGTTNFTTEAGRTAWVAELLDEDAEATYALDLAEVDGTVSGLAVTEKGKIEAFKYVTESGSEAFYTIDGGFTTEEPPAGGE